MQISLDMNRYMLVIDEYVRIKLKRWGGGVAEKGTKMQYFLCYFEEFCARLNKEGGRDSNA